MQIKKSVLKTRLQKRLDELQKQKKAVEATFPKYCKAYVKYLDTLKKQILSANSYDEFNKMAVIQRPDQEKLKYGWEDHAKRIKRNIMMLDSVEGEVVEIERLQTGRNYSLGTMLDDMFTD